LRQDNKVFIEDLDLESDICEIAESWANVIAQCVFHGDDDSWQAEFRKRFVILPDNAFDYFSQTATEIQPHVRIDPDFKRVEKGALWYEEALPTESILTGLVWCDRVFVKGFDNKKVIELLLDQTTQMGGKGTVGKGRVRLRFAKMTDGVEPSETDGDN